MITFVFLHYITFTCHVYDLSFISGGGVDGLGEKEGGLQSQVKTALQHL